MSVTDSFQSDIRKNPAELEREADRARASLERTLDALETRLSPSALLNHVVESAKASGGDFSANLLNQVRNNPLPSILAGVSIAWLMAASKRPPPSARATVSTGDQQPFEDGLASARESWRGATDPLRDAAASTRETFNGVSEGTREAAGKLADATRESWHSVAATSRAGARTVGHSFYYLRDEQPLILGALAIAAGALVGGLLPRTESEDRWLGAMSAGARGEIKDTARKAMDAVKGAASDIAGAARSAAQRTGGAVPSNGTARSDGEDELDSQVGTQNADLDAADHAQAGWSEPGKQTGGEDPPRIAH
jgi:hypothetical protein